MLLGSPEAEVERLWQLCVNAEPNYGTLWFHCKSSVLLTTRQVLEAATDLLEREIKEYAHVYQAAVRRAATPSFRSAALATVSTAIAHDVQGEVPASDGVPTIPSSFLPPLDIAAYAPHAVPADFVTGCVGLNRMHRHIGHLTFEERRALIYGGDIIVP